jgi:hypothetical protein
MIAFPKASTWWCVATTVDRGMGTTPALLEHHFDYRGASSVSVEGRRKRLSLSTSGGTISQPVLFAGTVTPAARVAQLLLVVARVSRTRFYTPAAMTAAEIRLADPVITSHGDRLRFESFSSCGSTYARLDLLPAAVECETAGLGTTNVDFNGGMRSALSKILDDQPLRLEVGVDAFTVRSGGSEAVERQVALPDRWIRGFSEVQSVQTGLELMAQLGSSAFLRFSRQLPSASASTHHLSAVPAGDGLRLTRQPRHDAIGIGGPHRLRALADVGRGARAIRVYGGAGASAWEFDHDGARLVLVFSPEAGRGFSGEGSALRHLADGDGSAIASALRPSLRWQSVLRPEQLADLSDLDEVAVRRGLAALGAMGELGFDLAEMAYFHRPLPFGSRAVEAISPRLRDARCLVDDKAVFLLTFPDFTDTVEAMVHSGGIEHRVTITSTRARCTCPWFGQHRGARGPCKHELAVRLFASG